MLLVKSLLLVCSAVAVMAKGSSSAIVSGAIFVGKDTTSSDASAVDIFRNAGNHAAAAASIVVYSAKGAKFDPANQDPSDRGSYSNFLNRVTTFPGFLLYTNFQSDIKLTGSLDQLEEQIKEADGSSDASLIARNIRGLIPASIKDTSLDKWVLSLIVIGKPADSDTVTLKHVQLTLNIKSDESQKTYIPEQTATLRIYGFTVIQNFIEMHANTLADRIPIVKVPDFIAYLTSPKTSDDLWDSFFFERDTSSCRQKSAFMSRRHQYRIAQWLLQE
ncbi:hypothetical protein BGX28_002576 [Mortierella sp. GBA30]|nr:hypothetical protein BGX28_002576 [Mortierella sp. GBA30]